MMLDQAVNILSAAIEYSYGKVDNVRQLLTNLLREFCIGEENISRIELAVYEAIVNIIEHSAEESKANKIIVNCYINIDRIEIVICNYGKRFDITTIKLPNIEEHYRIGERRGLGVYFIRTLMDEVEYSYKNKINCTTLIKRIHPKR